MVQSAKSRNHEADLTVGGHFAKLTLQAAGTLFQRIYPKFKYFLAREL